MSKIRVIGHKKFISKVISSLHELEVLHIVEEDIQDFELGKPLVVAEELSAALVQTRTLKAQFNLGEHMVKQKHSLKDIIKTTQKLTEESQKQNLLIKAAKESLAKHEDEQYIFSTLKTLGVKEKHLTSYDNISLIMGTIQEDPSFASLRNKDIRYEVYEKTIRGEKHIVVIVEKRGEELLKETLSKIKFNQLYVPQQFTKNLSKKIAQEKKTIKEAQKKLEILKKEAQLVCNCRQLLKEELKKAQLPLQCKISEQTFVLHGFVPNEKFNEVVQRLESVSSEKISVEKVQPHKGEKIPTKMVNPEPVKSFKLLMDLYSVPRYKEIDPSWILFLTFPLFFGFMLGDMGYGILTLGIFYILKRILPKAKAFLNILMLSSVSSIFFGIIFAEYFGFELYHPLISRHPGHSLTPLMVTSVVIGFIHINVGLMLGFVNELKHHGLVHAFFHKCGWFVLQLAVILLGLSYAQLITLPTYIGYLVLALAIAIIYKGEGVAGLAELPGIFGNMLSYMRLMAIGLSSVGIAMVVNDLSGGFIQAGGFSIIIGIIIAVGGHLFNAVLGSFGGFLHSLRLHYVELFGKFYSGGGIAYSPFGQNTEE